MPEQQPEAPVNETPETQGPPPAPAPPTAPPAPPPSPPREVRIAPDERLNLAYDPHFTHAAEAREALLQDLVRRSQRGARARCSRCERISVRFLPFKTPFGTYVIALCEQCGAWYLM